MGTNEAIVSPYVLQPLRSYKDAMRDRAAKIQCKGRHYGVGSADSRCSVRREADDVELSK